MKLQKERGSDLTIFSPARGGMAHHVGSEATGIEWSRMSNDLIHRVCALLPDNFRPVGQLPQHRACRARRTASPSSSASPSSASSA